MIRSEKPDSRTVATAIRPRRATIVWAALAGAAVLVAVMIFAGRSESVAPTDEPVTSTAQDNSTSDFDPGRRIADDMTALGAVDAPVVIVEYADYRCPFCGVFDRNTLPTIVADYIDDGKVRFEWRDFPIFGEESIGAAVATRAAGEQGLFWEYHTALFAGAPERGHPDFPTSRLVEFAREVNVPDLDRFVRDLEEPGLLDRVRADYLEGKQIGVSSTPIFLVNETPVMGAQPLSVFRQIIDGELAKTSRTDGAK
ncbi:protein-disulfide isomerase [Rhodococcus sp. 27YEA15]|uniref:DsbA family protein n=1 Tax=Rhodococcus sp. 27YEA15 TaxID=3156259 RepID=UPI003C7E2A44